MKSLGGKFSCDVALMKPSAEVPQDANHVRPADIRHIGAMGDSFAIGLHSTNYDGEMADIFPGNSFFTGADESLSQHVTIANILRELNPQIGGVSYGKGSAKASFNVAVPWTNSEDLPRQAEDLVNRIKMKGRMVWMYEWKLIAIFTGIHDLGFLSCHDDRTQEPTPAWQYKTNIENAIGILRAALNRTIVVLIPILTPRVLIGAEYMIDRIPKPCWLGNVIRDHRDYHVWDLNKMLKKIQYERKFECSGFAVVLQDFVDNVLDPVLNRNEEDQEIFYAHDLFHLSKYGNAVFATHLWNSLLDPVGSAATNFSDTTVTLKCPSELALKRLRMSVVFWKGVKILPRVLLVFFATIILVKRHQTRPPKSHGVYLTCDYEVMLPSKVIPRFVDNVRPADIKAIGAMGDSLLWRSLDQRRQDTLLHGCGIAENSNSRSSGVLTHLRTAENHNKNAFYDDLNTLISKISSQRAVIVGIDSNTKMGLEQQSDVLGKWFYPIQQTSDNGNRLIDLCEQTNLIIASLHPRGIIDTISLRGKRQPRRTPEEQRRRKMSTLKLQLDWVLTKNISLSHT
ncbi:hypothetical protein RB195_014240 [Necator americanus]|uniref:GDSL-like protein n=1 Tax=Necator americanus TaxID=51031 RepID=A0ABR1DZC6_NECAM